MTDGAMLTEILEVLEISCDKCSFHGKLDALAAGLGISTEGRLLGDVLDDIAAKEGIQRDNRLYGAFIRKLYDYVTNGEDVTLTGNPLVLANSMGRPLKECVVSWEPTQEGSGEPYPAGGGPNLLDITQCTATIGKPYGLTITIDGDIIKASGIPSSEVTEEGQYSFAVASCAQTELRGKGYKVTAFAIKGEISNAWGLRTEDESSLAISAKLTPGVDTDIQFRLMVSKDTPTAYAPYANVRPISGRTQVKVERCGENLLDLSPNNVESGIFNNGEKSDGAAGQQRIITPIMVNPKQVLVYTTDRQLKYNVRATFLSAAGEYLSNIGLTPDTVFKAPDNAHQMFIHSNGYGLIGNDAPWYEISVGTTPPDAYSPYTADDYTLIFPKEVIGADVDVTTSTGKETWKLLTLDGTENWNTWGVNAYNSAVTGFYTYDINDYDAENVKGICSNLPHSDADTWGGRNSGIGFATTGAGRYFMYCLPTAILADTSDNSAAIASLKSFFAAQYAAGTPVQIAYKLATPAPFQATGGGAIPTVKGTNTLLTDADTIKATYRCNVHAAEQELDTLYTDLLQELEE